MMSRLSASFRHSALSYEPVQLTNREIWGVAQQVRSQLGEPLVRRLELGEVGERAGRLEVNGIRYSAIWDFDHDVRNARDEEVLGVTEYHDATPLHVLVSINGPRLNTTQNLWRSTVAHELGHVIFDAPAWLARRDEAFVQVASDISPGLTTHWDPMELRANEFMGALLVPAVLVRVDWLRVAKRNRLPVSQRPSQIILGAPAVDGRSLDTDQAAELMFELGELYGVSADFIRVRLARYDLLRTPRPAVSH